ncbi:MAG TPA: hypothetical protein ENK85_02310 [Saprospiraceae bacterium]|nr:hypothetical protein [Saprospiraceae bacterium]
MKLLEKINEKLRKSYWMLGVGLLLVVAMSAARVKRHSHTKELVVQIASLETEGGGFLIMERDVKRIIQNSFVEEIDGMDLNQVQLDRMEKVLEDDPFVKDAEVWIDANNKVHIKVLQRQPIVRIIDNNGLNYYFDKTGRKMPTSKYATARVPVATGYLPAYFNEFRDSANPLNDVFKLAKFLNKNELLSAMISQISVGKSGEITLIPEFGKTKIILGKADDLPGKFKKLLIFYKEAMPHKGWRKYQTINLKFANQVVCKRW